MDTLESKRMCRLCGKQLQNSIAHHIFDSPEHYDKKIQTLLAIWVHRADFLPKYLCYMCSTKLEELHNFYIQTMKFDIEMKNKLSWMQNKNDNTTDGIPIVYFADLKSIKVKIETENTENYNTLQENSNFNLIKSTNVDCNVKKSIENLHTSKSISLPKYIKNDDNIQKYCDKNNIQLPLNVTIPLVRINNQLQYSRTITNMDSNNKFTDTINLSQTDTEKLTFHEDTMYNNTTDNISKRKIDNFHSSIVFRKLIKSETKENDQYIRMLRPRCKLTSDKSSPKLTEKKQTQKLVTMKKNNKPKDSIIDSKLSKKVEIKVEKLQCDSIVPSTTKIMSNTNNCNKFKYINNIQSNNNIQTTVKKSKFENKSVISQIIKPLRTQNNLREISEYESKVKIHMKSIKIKLKKINVSNLKKQKNTCKTHNKISKIKRTIVQKKSRKIQDSYSCSNCNKQFTKRELYRLHCCYIH